ncbi:HNH endonuclease [Pseudonocardia lutea]|uniref:HNH endonuclease n=1 Tax=Pseudonocardia lutea TaxID=2172015 RepID=A0ABW1I054_9PSEU
MSSPSSPHPRPGRAERLRAAPARDGDACVWCGRRCVGLVAPTTDHLVPKVKGGPSWVENEVVACRRCNAARGHRSPAEWFAECERRGWEPNLTAVLGALRELDAAIAVRGGQRRARPYLAAQLRRLARAEEQRRAS